MNEPQKVPFDDLEYMHGEDSSMYDGMLCKGVPFTGVAVDDFNDSHSEIPFVDGKPHGRMFEVSSDGILLVEENIEHGVIIESTSRYRNGNLCETYRKEPFMKKCWYTSGQLQSEWFDERRTTYYEDGTLKKKHDKNTGICVCYSHSGEWFAKITSDTLQYVVLDVGKTEFNEHYMENNYIGLLEDDIENICYFDLWLKMKCANVEQNGSIRKELIEIIGNLIRSNDLRVKYAGLNYAEQYKLSELASLIKKQLKHKVAPPKWFSENGLHSYGWTIAERARKVLKNI